MADGTSKAAVRAVDSGTEGTDEPPGGRRTAQHWCGAQQHWCGRALPLPTPSSAQGGRVGQMTQPPGLRTGGLNGSGDISDWHRCEGWLAHVRRHTCSTCIHTLPKPALPVCKCSDISNDISTDGRHAIRNAISTECINDSGTDIRTARRNDISADSHHYTDSWYKTVTTSSIPYIASYRY